jgi:hypothetical protein
MKFRYDRSFQSSGTRRLGALDVAYQRTSNLIYGDYFFEKELRSTVDDYWQPGCGNTPRVAVI